MPFALGEDRLGDIGPDGFARRAHVEHAAQVRIIRPRSQVARHGEDHIGDVERAGRASRLVGDDADLVARFGEAQHRLDEVLAEGAVDPGRAQDGVVVGGGRDRPFAGELARAIGRDRAGRIVFAIGPVEPAVEDIIGRELDHGDAQRRCGTRRFAGSLAIDAHGEFGLALGLIHGGIGGRVDDHVGPRRTQRRRDRLRDGEVEIGPAQRDDLDADGHALQHGADDLAGPTGDGDAKCHQSKYRSISARRGCLRSLSERVRPERGRRQSMPSAGSSKARPWSFSGA